MTGSASIRAASAAASPPWPATATTTATTGRTTCPTTDASSRGPGCARPQATPRPAATATAVGCSTTLKTRDTVADMESLRKALGRQQINFYGFSYGTYLGPGLRHLYPNRVRRIVLDGNVDPPASGTRPTSTRTWPSRRRSRSTSPGWPRTTRSTTSVTPPTSVDADVLPAAGQAGRHPGAGGMIGPDELTDVLPSAGYYVYGWVKHRRGVRGLGQRRRREPRSRRFYDAATPGRTGTDNGYAVYSACSAPTSSGRSGGRSGGSTTGGPTPRRRS